MKKNDIIIIVLVLVLTGGVYLFNQKINDNKTASELAVCVDGEIIDTISLYEDGIYKYEDENGYKNTIEISGGKVNVIKANCPNQVCVDTVPISRAGETIVCLPHHFYVKILGEKEDELDAIAE